MKKPKYGISWILFSIGLLTISACGSNSRSKENNYDRKGTSTKEIVSESVDEVKDEPSSRRIAQPLSPDQPDAAAGDGLVKEPVAPEQPGAVVADGPVANAYGPYGPAGGPGYGPGFGPGFGPGPEGIPPFGPPIGPIEPIIPIPPVVPPFHDGRRDHDRDDDRRRIDNFEVDVLSDLMGDVDAFGDSGAQGMLRQIDTILVDGSSIPGAIGQLPLFRGVNYLVAGFIYPKGTLDSCRENPSEPCRPADNLKIGFWVCWGWAINDANTTETGDILLANEQAFNFTDWKLEGQITTAGLEANHFTDTETISRVSLTGGSGDFAGATGETLIKSNGATGSFEEGNASVLLRVKFKFGLYTDEEFRINN